LDELVPLYRAPGTDDMPATQFNMKWVEQAGLVKFDFLGLKTLTQIDNAVNLIRKTRDLHVAATAPASTTPPRGPRTTSWASPSTTRAPTSSTPAPGSAAVFQVESSA
jgi:DNA polymerase-3 subunit alpha